MNSTTPPPRPLPAGGRAPRADARRNYDTLLAAAKTVFARAGADAPMEEVARRAGVGQGTLYRHFPTREHLFVELMRERVELLDRTARDLLETPDPWQALAHWLQLYDQSATEYRGMSMRVAESLADDDSPVAAACAPMKTSFGALFDRARKAKVVRRDVNPLQLLTMISALPKDPERGTTSHPYLDIVLKGLRP